MNNISKIKIEIITKQNIPININNPVLNYIQDKDRKGDRLLAKVYYDDVEIGRGVILDFYKQFEIIESLILELFHLIITELQNTKTLI